MRKTVIYLIMGYGLCILFMSTPGFINAQEQAGSSVSQDPFREQALMDTYQGPTVTISGKLIFPAYKQGQQIKIVVKALPAKGKETTLIAVADLSQPGDYSLNVPRDSGEVYINMVVLEPVKQAPDAYMPIKGLSGSDRFLEVGSSDIKGADITIGEGNQLAPLMDTYQGPTVTISGKLIFPAYKQGQQIKIVVKALPAKGKETTLIAVADLSQPGDYSLNVPRDSGEVYINMVVLEPVKQAPDAYMPIARSGKFLKVGSFDIKRVVIAIWEAKK